MLGEMLCLLQQTKPGEAGTSWNGGLLEQDGVLWESGELQEIGICYAYSSGKPVIQDRAAGAGDNSVTSLSQKIPWAGE